MTSEERAGQEERKPRRRWLIVALALTLLVAVVAGVWAARGRLSGGALLPALAPMPDMRTIDLSAHGLSCPSQPTWSPDGTMIAVLAYKGDCMRETHGLVQTIAVFDAHTGALKRAFLLNPMLYPQNFSWGGLYTLTDQFAWSPDSASLVFSVNTDTPTEQLPPEVKHGLVILSVTTGSMRTFADPAPMPLMTQASTIVWDTRTGALAHIAPGLSFASAYTWSADGLPEPSAAGKGAAGKGAVGFWQAGRIIPVFSALAMGVDVPSGDPPQAYYYVSTMTQWSPDGRYVALPLTLGARLPGGSNPQASQTGDECPDHFTQACQLPAVSLPDAGFGAVLKAAEVGWVHPPQSRTSVPISHWSFQDVAWRADGQEVATMLPGQGFALQQPTASVTIFNTRTGAQVRTLTIKRVDTTFDGEGQFAWAPSGASLALADYNDAILTLWRSV